MSDSAGSDSAGDKKVRDQKASASDKEKQAQTGDDERMEDEEKIMAGRHDINYPALLTKDVPGG